MAEPDPTAPNAPISRSTKIVYGVLFGFMALLAISRLAPDSKPSGDAGVPAPVPKVASVSPGAGLDSRTSCAAALDTFDHAGPDGAITFDRTIEKVMRQADQVHVRRDRSGIIAGLSRAGFLDVRMTAIVTCRQHPEMTLSEAAQDMYEGVRDLQRSLGVR